MGKVFRGKGIFSQKFPFLKKNLPKKKENFNKKESQKHCHKLHAI
jgi:hypothetical protein